MAAGLLSSCTALALASSAKAEWVVFDSVVEDQQVKRGEIIIDPIFDAAVRLNKVSGQI